MLVANLVETAMGTDHNEVAILDTTGVTRLPVMPKPDVARAIVKHIAARLPAQS
jgi:phosphopantothenoylcysteine decarboxylase/phosphopantothenate--cysteine ligase